MSILRCASCDRSFDSDFELPHGGDTGFVECEGCADRRMDQARFYAAPEGPTSIAEYRKLKGET